MFAIHYRHMMGKKGLNTNTPAVSATSLTWWQSSSKFMSFMVDFNSVGNFYSFSYYYQKKSEENIQTIHIKL